MIAAASVEFLRSRGVPLDPGLTPAELATIEDRFGFGFSPDHRDFLSLAVPGGGRWIDWRGDAAALEKALSWPREGALFDVRENAVWPSSWGEAPTDLQERLDVARERIARWPTLVPVYGHRYLPAAPAGPGAPVFSVWQTDVIFYGRDLLDYVKRELGDHTDRRSLGETDPYCLPPWSLFAYGLDDEA